MVSFDWDIMALVEYAWDSRGYKLNGRDIQNAVQSAVALAKYANEKDELDEDRPRISSNMLKSILETSKHFDKVDMDFPNFMAPSFESYIYPTCYGINDSVNIPL